MGKHTVTWKKVHNGFHTRMKMLVTDKDWDWVEASVTENRLEGWYWAVWKGNRKLESGYCRTPRTGKERCLKFIRSKLEFAPGWGKATNIHAGG